MLRPDGVTTHANINSGVTPVKFFWFVNQGGIPFHAPAV
jgi:hypothetical protein